jgi:hypothetical protein
MIKEASHLHVLCSRNNFEVPTKQAIVKQCRFIIIWIISQAYYKVDDAHFVKSYGALCLIGYIYNAGYFVPLAPTTNKFRFFPKEMDLQCSARPPPL